MAKRTVEESSLTMVADAIREGSGTTGDMEFPGEFQERAKSMANAVKFTEQTLTEEQKAQARANIGLSVVEPAEDDTPKVFLTGAEFSNMTTAKNEVNMGLEYVSKTDKFKAAIKIKFQGNSSLDYPKKSFTIKMYTDDTYEDKLKKSFKDWNHSGNKYVLKANYIDHAHARNIISANLWSEVVASRPDYDSLPVEMRNSPRNGAIDGFPVKLYVNGTYQGIYTWNIGKDDWMWGMDEDNANHVLMCAETNDNGNKTSTPCNFRALWSGTDENHWTVEVGTNSAAVKTALNNLIQFVMNNDGDDFRNGIGQYLDIQSAIDYYIFMYDVCGLDGLAKNMLLATYDCKIWRCGAYDMDSTFGLYWNGTKFVATTYRCPEDYQETNSLLWERVEANFKTELKARQAELRKSVLSYSNIVTHFERFMDVIGLDLYAEDLTIYTGIPSGSTNNIKQIRNYIRDRQAYVDAEFAAMSEPIPCTGISLSASELTFNAEGTQTLTATVTPDGCTDSVTWDSDNTSVAIVSGGVVTAIANGNATITARCGNYSASCSVTVSGIEESGGTELPNEYTELTYIESNGTQHIDTGVTGGSSSAYEIEFNAMQKRVDFEQYLSGGKSTPTSKLLNFAWGTFGVGINCNADWGLILFDYDNTVHTVRLADNRVYRDDVEAIPDDSKQVKNGGWGTNKWWVFNSPDETDLGSSMRLYHLKMWTDGELVRDFVPAMRNSDGAIGLYDTVTQTFFENAGTGTFAYA